MGNNLCMCAGPVKEGDLDDIFRKNEKGAVATKENKADAAIIKGADEQKAVAANQVSKGYVERPLPSPAEPQCTDIVAKPRFGADLGLPYSYNTLGPAQPPCNEDRLKTMKMLNLLDAPSDPEVSCILDLVTNIFQAKAALVAFFGEERIFVRDTKGEFGRGDFPWRQSFCAWTMSTNNATTMVIEDATQDARFRDNHVVKFSPGVRFYCGTPLIASNGHRLGTLCFIDFKPRKFDVGSCHILNNLAELVVRQVEKDLALQIKAADNEVLKDAYGKLKRAIDCFENCVLLVDIKGEGGWQMLYANLALTQLTGLEREELLGSGLSNILLNMDGNPVLTEKHIAMAQQGAEFRLTNVVFNGGNGQKVNLLFRPAGKGMVDEDMLPINVPNFLSVGEEMSKEGFYFVLVDKAATTSRASLDLYSATSERYSLSQNQQLEGLQLCHMLGQGAYGRVYFGSWFGTPVAVKVMEHDLSTGKGIGLEAVVGQEMKHPNIVACLMHCTIQKGHMDESAASEYSDDSSTRDWMSGKTPKDVSDLPPLLEADVEEVDCTFMGTGKNSTAVGTGKANPAAGKGKDGWATKDGLGVVNSQATMSSVAGSKMSHASQDESCGSSISQTMLVLEYCDRGTLQDAVDKGWFRSTRSRIEGEINITAIAATALEVASALAFLHSRDIVHGDMSAWNVMLSSEGPTSSIGGRGFVAKVADFGLARMLDVKTRVETRTYGTLTHMPPETLEDGVISTATDVYSFGVLMWQMLTTSRPWAGLSHGQIILAVCSEKKTLQFPPEVDPVYAALATSCMAPEPSERPKMEDICAALNELAANV